MIYKVDDLIINIDANKRVFGKGSEGVLYKIDDILYKIYYKESLYESYGSKEQHHMYMMQLPTKKIVLPDKPIYDEEDKYAGYTSKLINGDQKERTGISLIPKENLLKNLKELEDEIKILSNHRIMMADVQLFNYMYDKDNEQMYIIDPGRYTAFNFDKNECLKQNMIQYEYLIDILVMREIYLNKSVNSKKKMIKLKNFISMKKEYSSYSASEFFEKELGKCKTLNDYLKNEGKYIK